VPEAKLAQLSSIVRSFRAPIRYAFAYGSGIFAQTPSLGDSPSSSSSTKKPMLDFIFATTHADHFHSINLQQNPSHYPGYARLAGSEAVSWVQRKGGAGVWFNAFCEVEGAVRCIRSALLSRGSRQRESAGLNWGGGES
jgi:translocator assembly and maintenance protein 41